MEIILAPNPILSQKAKPVSKVDRSILKIIGEMKKALEAARDPTGVGLAAPQIGKSLQIFIAKLNPKSKTLVFINPVIIQKSKIKSQKYNSKLKNKRELKEKPTAKGKKPETKLEGCLSLKDIWGSVLRSPQVSINYLDEKGENHTKTFKWLFATIVQHEFDHLDGVLFTKRVLEQQGKLYKSHKNKKGEDVFEELNLP